MIVNFQAGSSCQRCRCIHPSTSRSPSPLFRQCQNTLHCRARWFGRRTLLDTSGPMRCTPGVPRRGRCRMSPRRRRCPGMTRCHSHRTSPQCSYRDRCKRMTRVSGTTLPMRLADTRSARLTQRRSSSPSRTAAAWRSLSPAGTSSQPRTAHCTLPTSAWENCRTCQPGTELVTLNRRGSSRPGRRAPVFGRASQRHTHTPRYTVQSMLTRTAESWRQSSPADMASAMRHPRGNNCPCRTPRQCR